MEKLDLIGLRFGTKVVIEECGRTSTGQIKWKYRCDCGTEKIAASSSVRKSYSCGCKNKTCKTHGMSNTRVFKIWSSMLRRCRDKNHICYKYYGERGITVCERWLKFENFYSDMGDPPELFSIDRINPNGNYDPSNCKWSSTKEQNGNKTTTIFMTLDGVTMNLTQWAKKIGVSPASLHHRVAKLGLPDDVAIKTPFTKSTSNKKFNIK